MPFTFHKKSNSPESEKYNYNFRTEEQRNNQKLVTMDLLNRRAEEFQASDVLLKLPPEWSLATIAPALIKMAKGSIHKVHISCQNP